MEITNVNKLLDHNLKNTKDGIFQPNIIITLVSSFSFHEQALALVDVWLAI